MCKKNNIRQFIVAFSAAVLVFSIYFPVFAADGPCPDTEPGTCYELAGYTIELVEAGTPVDGGSELWSYLVSPVKKNDPFGAMLFAVDAEIEITEPGTNQVNAPCEGDQTYNYYVGECFRQVIEWHPNMPSSVPNIELKVRDNGGYGSMMPIALGASGSATGGMILGPTALAQQVATTLVVNQSVEGMAIAHGYDQTEKSYKYYTCPSECDNFPTNFDQIDESDLISFSDVYICLGTVEGSTTLPPNSELTFDGADPIICHSGQVLHLDEKTRIRIDHNRVCSNVGGRLICR